MASCSIRLAKGGRAVLLAAGLSTVALGPYGVAAVRARPAISAGLRSAEQGMAAARSGDSTCAGRLLAAASDQLTAGRRRLGVWWARPARLLPVVAPHARVVEELVEAGAAVAAAAAEASRLAGAPSLAISGGAMDLVALGRLQRPLDRTVAALQRALEVVSDVRSPFLVPAARRRLDAAGAQLARALNDGRQAAEAVRLAPDLLGGNGPRRYFLAIQNPAEQRASGGIIGNYAELTFTDGRVALERLGRNERFTGALRSGLAAQGPVGPADYRARYQGFGPERFFLNAPLSPDFPTVAHVIEELYPRFTGRPLDGVISADPLALAALLELTGPVNVPGWPVPLTSVNAARILLHEQYLHLSGQAREEFLLGVARAIFDRLGSVDLPPPAVVLRALGPAVRAKHLLVHSARPAEQRLFESAGAAGAIPAVRSDFVQVVTQNSGQNKIDWFQRRAISYRVSYEPRTGSVRSTVRVRLTNSAPADGLPGYVLGGAGYPVEAGHGRSWVSVYSPLGLDGATLDGIPVAPEREHELGRRVYSQFVTLGPGTTSVLELHLSGMLPAGGDYRLDVGRQPTISPDRLSVEVAGPSGWWVTSAHNLDAAGGRASGSVEQDQDRSFSARFEPRRLLAGRPLISKDGPPGPLGRFAVEGGPCADAG